MLGKSPCSYLPNGCASLFEIWLWFGMGGGGGWSCKMSNWINALATSALKVVKADMTLNMSWVLCMDIKDLANFLVNKKKRSDCDRHRIGAERIIKADQGAFLGLVELLLLQYNWRSRIACAFENWICAINASSFTLAPWVSCLYRSCFVLCQWTWTWRP